MLGITGREPARLVERLPDGRVLDFLLPEVDLVDFRFAMF
jgi:hypothetical protein